MKKKQQQNKQQKNIEPRYFEHVTVSSFSLKTEFGFYIRYLTISVTRQIYQ